MLRAGNVLYFLLLRHFPVSQNTFHSYFPEIEIHRYIVRTLYVLLYSQWTQKQRFQHFQLFSVSFVFALKQLDQNKPLNLWRTKELFAIIDKLSVYL